MKLIPYQDLVDSQWAELHKLSFDEEILTESGAQKFDPPSLGEFYSITMDQIEARTYLPVAILGKDDVIVGAAQLLLGTHGEWEIGVALRADKRGFGYGPKAVISLLNLAKEQGIEWVVAFSYGTDERVRDMLVKLGFRPFMHFYVLDVDKWGTSPQE